MAELENRTLGRYELRQMIGKGGMANVYEAYDPSFQRVVAVKVFKREDEEMLRRFIREAELMANLHHPHLVEVYDTGESQLDGITRYYIVMPLLAGGTLRLRIRRSPLRLEEVCQCLRDIASALDYIHSKGIVHRDIKASNVLLNEEGRCYLTDFGIARITTDATQLTSTGNVLGTVDYVAPELFEVHRRADALSDLYSLGVLLYEMVTGRLPFSADNQLALISMHVNKMPPSPRQFVPQLPSNIESVVSKALAKQPEKRYASATKLADAFCQAVKQSGIKVPSMVDIQPYAETNPGQGLEHSAVGVEQHAAVSNPPRTRSSPRASATESFVVAPLPQGSAVPETPRFLPRPGAKFRLTRKSFVLLLVVAGLLLASISLVYAGLSHSASSNLSTPTGQTSIVNQQSPSPAQTSPTPGSTQTALAGVAATATSQAHATSTAIVAPSATAQARATATMGPIATAISGQTIYQDSLTDGNSASVQQADWDQSSQCVFDADGYHLLQPASPTYFKGCREQNDNYGNMALTVNIKLLSGHSGGVYFRLSTNLLGNYDGYLFEIDSQANYKISRQQGSSNTPLQDWGPSSALRTGYGVTNSIQLIARDNVFQFYANGQFINQVTDGANYYGPSDTTNTLGFLASTTQGGSAAEVIYSDLKVYAL